EAGAVQTRSTRGSAVGGAPSATSRPASATSTSVSYTVPWASAAACRQARGEGRSCEGRRCERAAGDGQAREGARRAATRSGASEGGVHACAERREASPLPRRARAAAGRGWSAGRGGGAHRRMSAGVRRRRPRRREEEPGAGVGAPVLEAREKCGGSRSRAAKGRARRRPLSAPRSGGRTWHLMPPKTILLATDLSCRTDRALDRAAALAAEWQARLVVVHALQGTASISDAPSWRSEADPRALALKQVREDLRGTQVQQLE